MGNKIGKFIYWSPRILASLFVVFLALMSLDVFEIKASIWQILGGLFMHNIPTLILLAVLVISWKYEMVGGVVFILAGISYIFMVVGNASDWRLALAWSLQISGMCFIIGGLFIANWLKKKK